MDGYLVLSRKENQRVIITVPPSDFETRIEVLVVEVATRVLARRKTRLGFKTKPHVRINRSEVEDRLE